VEEARLIDTRYLLRGGYKPNGDSTFLEQLLNTSARDFKALFRVTRAEFKMIVSRVRGHSAFRRREGQKKKMRPVEYQVLTFLHYLGTKGCTYVGLSSYLRIGVGTVKMYVERVSKALRSYAGAAISWPNAEERILLRDYYGRHYHWPLLVGAVDGSCIPLFCRPSLQGGDYHDRKSNYSVNIQIVVDPHFKVT